MKLSEKGLHKIQTWQSAVALGFPMRPNELVFDSDDFVGGIAITLTKGEAEFVHEYFNEVFPYRVMPCKVYEIWDEVCKCLNTMKKENE